MNQEIPKPLRNALARQRGGDVHPSPDVLTSFMERTLPALQSEVVVHHLAQCAECREIVFLASEAAEDEVRNERLVAAAAPNRVAAMPVYADAASPATFRPDVRRFTRNSWVRWGVPIAAVVMLVSAVLVLQLSRGRKYSPAPLTVASNRPAPTAAETQATATAPYSQEALATHSVPPASVKSVQPGTTTAARAGKASPSTAVARNDADQTQAAPTAEETSKARNSAAIAAAMGNMNTAALSGVRPQNSFAESETAQAFAQPGAPLMFGKAQVGLHAVSVVRPQWRISPQGHLERSSVPDVWTHVLDDQPVTFRAVAAMGDDVWAGGNGGALFHSADRGEHWSKVSLAANSKVEADAIVSIHFEDPQHGVVTTDNGTRWATTDGGLTWLKQ
jgi:hypothetical protein